RAVAIAGLEADRREELARSHALVVARLIGRDHALEIGGRRRREPRARREDLSGAKKHSMSRGASAVGEKPGLELAIERLERSGRDRVLLGGEEEEPRVGFLDFGIEAHGPFEVRVRRRGTRRRAAELRVGKSAPLAESEEGPCEPLAIGRDAARPSDPIGVDLVDGSPLRDLADLLALERDAHRALTNSASHLDAARIERRRDLALDLAAVLQDDAIEKPDLAKLLGRQDL